MLLATRARAIGVTPPAIYARYEVIGARLHYLQEQSDGYVIQLDTMPKQHKGDTLISDSKLKRVTNYTLVTWVNDTRRW